MKTFINSWNLYVYNDNVHNIHESIEDTVENIFDIIETAGGEIYIVGGAVRDLLIPEAPVSKDVDFIVRGLEMNKLNLILSNLGKVSEVGKSFGILKAIIDGEEFDFSLPRTEKRTGSKHTDFEIVVDPHASIEDDMIRRDFTMNALLKDSNGKIIDFFNGIDDINNRLIRTVGNPNERFNEDPLRILRALQFAVRFGFEIEKETAQGIKNNINRIKSISPDRIYSEFRKAWTKGFMDGNHLQNLLIELGLGEVLFGFSFNPTPINSFKEPQQNVIANFVAMFLRGGNYENLKPTTEMESYLNIAKQLDSKESIITTGNDAREKLSLLKVVFEKMGKRDTSKKIEKILSKPMNGRELEISGRDLMELGIYGPDVGIMIRKILDAISIDEIHNDHDEIKNFVKNL